MEDWLTNLGTGLVVAIVTSVVTVRLSLKSFVSQRWWERKAEAYSQIMEQLSYREHYDSAWIEATEEGRETGTEWLSKRGEESAEAYRSLRRAAAIGEFVISERAAQALRELQEPDPKVHRNDRYGMVDDSLYRTRLCMKAIREEAERDLSPGRFGFWR